MKKYYLLTILFLVASLQMSAQITLSQTTSNEIDTGTEGNRGTVACDYGEPDYITADNSYYRAFDLEELGYSEFAVQEVTFGVEFAGNVSPDFAIEIILYGSSGADFPDGTLTEVARVSVPITEDDTEMLKTVPISGTVDERQLVAEISIPDEFLAGNTTSFYLGGNNLGESAPTYTFSQACNDPEIITFESIDRFGQHLILDVTGTATTLSNEDLQLTDISLYPNPAQDQVNIKTSNNDILKKVEVYSTQGQKLMESSQDIIDISTLSSGVYLFKIETEKGFATKQITKQ